MYIARIFLIISYVVLLTACKSAVDLSSANGKYSGLTQQLTCLKDKGANGKYHDYGYWRGGAWCGERGKAGYWVWVAPTWYVWSAENKLDGTYISISDQQEKDRQRRIEKQRHEQQLAKQRANELLKQRANQQIADQQIAKQLLAKRRDGQLQREQGEGVSVGEMAAGAVGVDLFLAWVFSDSDNSSTSYSSGSGDSCRVKAKNRIGVCEYELDNNSCRMSACDYDLVCYDSKDGGNGNKCAPFLSGLGTGQGPTIYCDTSNPDNSDIDYGKVISKICR